MAALPKSPALPFELWRERLRADCVARDRMVAFNAMGDYVLRVLWNSGLEPTCEAIEAQESKEG